MACVGIRVGRRKARLRAVVGDALRSGEGWTAGSFCTLCCWRVRASGVACVLGISGVGDAVALLTLGGVEV